MIIFVVIICISGLLLLLTVYSISFIKNVKFSLKDADKEYKPKAVIFIPCKHNFKTLKQNLESIQHQDYKGEFHIIYIVESEKDGAYPVIRQIIENNKNTELIIAGTAINSSQKNHNILKAIEKLENEKRNDFEVYAFFDSDHQAPTDWLEKLILTLSIKNCEISTFHSLKQPAKLFPTGNIIYSMLNNYIYSVNTFSNQAWGGSLAMRKKTYLKYDIEKIWSTSVSHDCPINGIRAKIIFNPQCSPNETHYSYKMQEFIKWSTRQFTNWKHYSLNFWCLSFFSILANLIILYIFITLAIIKIIFSTDPVYLLIIGTYIILSYLILSVFISFKMKKKLLWTIIHFFMIPVFLNVLIISFIKSIFNKNINWAGKNYSIGKKGDVLDIKSMLNN
ncbi:MAG: glycosyltransferase family 2 protein [Spirochaetes bacterium]|nr:glycosyltransferase family 2 protein [Spirochaetota bacterium]